jgi:hypothetical protein
MTDYRNVLERDLARVGPAPFGFDDVARRRDRKRRNKRIAAGVVGIAVFVAAVWIVRDVALLDRSETSLIPGGSSTTGPAETGPTETGPAVTSPAYNGPTYSLGPVTNEDLAVGESFMQAWVDGDGEAAAAMFAPDATFDGFQPTIFPALYDWFRAGGWTFEGGGCSRHGGYGEQGAPLDVVGCGFTFENDLTRALGMRPVPKGLSFVIDAGRIETAWFGGGGDCCHNMFGSPDPLRPDLPGGGPDLSGAVWDMFIEWLSTNHPEDFDRMYDPDYGYPVPGYPILDPASVKLWERYTDEFVASPQALNRSFSEWMANQSFEVQAGRICMTATQEFWASKPGGGPGFLGALADVSEETLVELRALPLDTEADRATMDAFVPLAERWIERFRQGAAEGATHLGFDTGSYIFGLDNLIEGCLLGGVLPY